MPHLHSPVFLVLLLVCGRSPAQADAPPTARLIVLNKAAASASLFDPATRKEVALVEVGDGPHEVAVAPDGRTAVVCNYGGRGAGSTLTVIDVPAARAVKTIALHGAEGTDGADRQYLRPHGVQFERSGRHVWVTSEASQRLLRVDVEAGTVVAAVPTQQGLTHMVVLSADGVRGYTASIRDGTMAAFRLGPAPKLDGPLAVVATGAGSEGIAVRPGTGSVWVSNRQANTVSVVDPDHLTVAHTLATEAFPIRVAFTPDGEMALVSCMQAGVLQAFGAGDREVRFRLKLHQGEGDDPQPVGVLVEPSGAFAYVACTQRDRLVVVDLAAAKVAGTIATRREPDGMAWAVFRPQ
jgi:YVTN family beta-propeller protein